MSSSSQYLFVREIEISPSLLYVVLVQLYRRRSMPKKLVYRLFQRVAVRLLLERSHGGPTAAYVCNPSYELEIPPLGWHLPECPSWQQAPFRWSFIIAFVKSRDQTTQDTCEAPYSHGSGKIFNESKDRESLLGWH